MLSDLEKAYEYLQQHDLITTFTRNCETATSRYRAMHTSLHSSFIRQAFKWAPSPEGQAFWNDHDNAILCLNIYLSATDVLNYIESMHTIANQPYEFW